MTQALTIDADTVREIQASVEDEQVPDAFLDYLDLTSALIEQGWGTETAKSADPPYNKVDQSMLQHVGNAVTALLQLYNLTDAFEERDLRNMTAMLVGHDLHKRRDQPDPEKEFDIETDEVSQFVEETGLADYAPDVSVAEFKAAMVTLHKIDDRSRTAEAPTTFDEYRPYLNFADAVASTPHPSDFTDLSRTHDLREALGGEYTINHHEVRRTRGLCTNLIHQSVADALDDRGYDLFTIYHEGCTYLGDQKQAEIPITDELIEDIYDAFIDNIQTTHPAFQDPSNFTGAVTLDNRYRYFRISDRDFFFADDPDDIARALVHRGVSDATHDGDVPDSVRDEIASVNQHIDTHLEVTRRLDGIARLVHSVQAELVPLIEPDDMGTTEVICDLFDISAETQTELRGLQETAPNLVEGGRKRWLAKYLLAQDVINRYYTGRQDSTRIEAISADLVAALNEYDGWDDVQATRTSDIYDELKTFILYNVTVDGRRLISETTGRDEYDRTDEARCTECSLCNFPTTAESNDGFRLLKDYPGDTTLEHYDGSERKLKHVEHEQPYCHACQLDLALRFTRQEATENTDNRLYVHLIPDYYYVPILWRTCRSILDSYLSVNTRDVDELAASVFDSDAANGYEEWLDNIQTSDTGPDLISDVESAFNPDTGFGTHAISREKPADIGETEELFTALTAVTYGGVRAYVTRTPVTRVRSDDFDTAVKLSDDFDARQYTGEKITLTELGDVLSSTAAMLRLTNARGRNDRDPLEALDHLTDLTPLPGAALLGQLADDDPQQALDYVDEARYLDEQLVEDRLADRDDTRTGAEWPLDITPSVTPDPADVYRAADALAGTAWPFMSPESLDKDTLCRPLDAACDEIAAIHDTVGDGVTASELRPRIEKTVSDHLALHYRPHGRHFGGRLAAFAEAVVVEVVNGICDGNLDAVDSLRSTLRDAFYAAMIELATTSLPTPQTND